MGTSSLWSVIMAAQEGGPEARAALGVLIKRYERSVVALIRRRPHPPDQTPEDLKQAFFTRMLAREDITRLDLGRRGHFRGWLHTAVIRFVCNDWDRWGTQRAGNRDTGPMASEPAGGETPEDLYLVDFAWETLRHAIDRLRDEQNDKARFDAIRRFLPGPEADLVAQAPIAKALGMTGTALAAYICRMRVRLRELLPAVIAETLDLDDLPPAEARQEVEREMALMYEILCDAREPWAP